MVKSSARNDEAPKKTLEFDLFAQLSYMAAIATSDVSRSAMFEYASKLPYSSSVYFRNIVFVAKHMNIDYAEACRIEADRTTVPEVKGLLLRMAGSLASGEDETEFLKREASVVGENYGNKYNRELEGLKKWTDAYVALVVAASLIVIVAVISMMIYPVGKAIVVGLASAMVLAATLGAWIIHVSAPKEFKTRIVGPSSNLQKRGAALFRFCIPAAAIVGSIMVLLRLDLGWILIAAGTLVFPPGFVMKRDDKVVGKKDNDMPTMVRVLGGVASATGTTVGDALGKVDRRLMGSMTPEVNALRLRLFSGIDPDLCWRTMVDETGSELIDRTVHMFWDPISVGGEPGEVGSAAALFSSKIAFLRASRGLVASTFQYLTLPLQFALVGLLEFIVEIMRIFTTGIGGSAAIEQSENSEFASSSLNVGDLMSFGNIDLELVGVLVTSVVLVLTVANSFAPKAAAGGHGYLFLYNLTINMIIAGVLMLAVPVAAGSIFNSILNQTG